jgi:hypothetical protein
VIRVHECHGHGGLHAHERGVAGSSGSGRGGLSTEAAWWTDSITSLVAVTVKEGSRGTAMVGSFCVRWHTFPRLEAEFFV